MARAIEPSTWKNGFQQRSTGEPWNTLNHTYANGTVQSSHYVTPPSVELLTSTKHNSLGLSVQRCWPTLYDGTNSPHGLPAWFERRKEVDVVICGAGPSGLEVALSLVRQGVSFRIIDQAETPLIAGRADSVQPRFLETLHQWGLAEEMHEEGPLIERTAIYKNGKKLFFGRSHQSDSRYRGLHVLTQGQVERIFLRDLLRHKQLVERSTTVKDFNIDDGDPGTHPVEITIRNDKTGAEEVIRSKFLVGSDGGASSIRKKLQIPFEGTSTDIYWGIMDCIFESDYPHAWMFGSIINSEHGGCVVIPREDGYIRLYTMLNTSATGPIAQSRQAADSDFQESGGKVEINSITPEEVLEQANKIFSPYRLKFAAPISWFAIWRISERVAQSYSVGNRVHLVGDAAHIHSVMGAFGLNASILDSANLAWKIGLCARGLARTDALVPTYEMERRRHAVRIIQTSGAYLRFVCNSHLPVIDLDGIGTAPRTDTDEEESPPVKYEESTENSGANWEENDKKFLARFFARNGPFLLGVDAPYGDTIVSPPRSKGQATHPPTDVKNGVRAPNPRVCFSSGKTGYLYDKMTGAAMFNIVIFASDLMGPIRVRLATFSKSLGSDGFFLKYGGLERFRIIVVAKGMPFDVKAKMGGEDLRDLRENSILLADDRSPDEDAHTTYGINHAKGAAVIVRPDLWVGNSFFPDEVDDMGCYFEAFLVPTEKPTTKQTNGVNKLHYVPDR